MMQGRCTGRLYGSCSGTARAVQAGAQSGGTVAAFGRPLVNAHPNSTQPAQCKPHTAQGLRGHTVEGPGMVD